MSYNDIRNAREGFVDSAIGDSLIKTESIIIGIVAFIALLIKGSGFITALVVGVGCVFVVPIIIGLIPSVARFFGIAFSIIWAVIGYFLGGAILGDSWIAGGIIALIVFFISSFKHKVFAGLGYSSVTKHMLDSVDGIRDNTAHMSNGFNENNEQNVAGNSYCSSCGAPLKAGANFCTKCGGRQ